MTKQETIEKAYGDHYEGLKANINPDNGYVYVKVIARQTTDKTEYEHFGLDISDVELNFDRDAGNIPVYLKWRPRSITGIENNNGWKKIETDKDLPKSYGVYIWLSDHGHTTTVDYAPGDSMPFRGATHWRRYIETPNPVY